MKFLQSICWLLVLGTGVPGTYAQTGPSLPALKPDTLPSALKQEARSIGTGIKGEILQGLPSQQLTQGIRLFEGSKPVSVSKLSAEADYVYFHDTAGLGLGVLRSLNGTIGYSVDYGVTLGGMPFAMNVRENNGIGTMEYTPFRNFYQFNFDHTQYLETLRSRLLEKLGPEAIMNSALNRVKAIRTQYEQQLQGEINKVQDQYSKEFKTMVPIPQDGTNLATNDLASLRNRFLPSSAQEEYQKYNTVLQNLIQTKDPKVLATDSSYHKALGEVKKYEAMESIYSRVTEYKQKFESNPLVRQLLSQSLYKPGALKAYLSDPANLGQVLDDQASLSTVQKLFYNIKQMDLGQNAVQSGNLGLSNLVNTGVNTQFQNKSATVGVIYGQNHSVNNWQQAGLTSAVTNEYSNLTGFTIGTGSNSPIDQSIAINLFHFNNQASSLGAPGNNGASYLPLAPRQDGAITLHTGIKLGELHTITLEVSKSFGSFQNSSTEGSKGPSSGSLFNNAGKDNYAGILSYTGELLKTDLKVYLKKVGLGYNNPGNVLLRSGESQVGLGLARKFWNQRLSVKYNGDYKRQVFDPYGNFVYSAFTNKVQTGFKIDRNDRVTLTYQRSDYKSDFYGQSSVTGVNSRLQLDGSYRFILGKKKVMNMLTVSRQEMSIPFSSGGIYTNTSLLITQTSSFLVGKNLLSLTILDNQSNNKDYYFNTSMFSSETNYNYTFWGLRTASCLGYYDNAGWNKQVGIRQQLSATIREKVNVDVQVGYKKAVQTIQSALANQLFVSATARYTFK
ncbi:MAG TPA: hypothetical protein VI233_17315 [Puia sp.]